MATSTTTPTSEGGCQPSVPFADPATGSLAVLLEDPATCIVASTVCGTDATQIQHALTRFDAAVRLNAPPSALKLLKPGVEADLVKDGLDLCGLPRSADLESLYGWHNGTGSSPGTLLGQMWLLPGFYLIALDEAIAHHSAFKDDSRWDPLWFPVFADESGDFYVLDFRPKAAPVVRRFYLEETEQPLHYQSLAAMINTAAAAFETGAVYTDETGFVDIDDDAFTTIAARLNPTVAWWTDPV